MRFTQLSSVAAGNTSLDLVGVLCLPKSNVRHFQWVFSFLKVRLNQVAFHDADAEAVREKAREELREESERVEMGAHDDRRELPAVEDDAPPGVSFGDADAVQHEAEVVEA